MPTLNWIGKEAVVKHHKAVPFAQLAKFVWFAGAKVICAAANRMGGRAACAGITFKQSPYVLEL